MSTLDGVPDENVGEVVQAFVEDEKTNVVCEKQTDGTWTITAE